MLRKEDEKDDISTAIVDGCNVFRIEHRRRR
jgi:hypothetical protein